MSVADAKNDFIILWYFGYKSMILWSYDEGGDRKHDTTTMSLSRMVLVRKPQRTAETSAHVGIVGYTEMKELSASYSWFPSTLLHQIIWFLHIESQMQVSSRDDNQFIISPRDFKSS